MVTEGAAAVVLGSAANFGVLAGTTVTNTGPTVVTGNVGVSPGTAITGFPPGIVLGTTHSNDAVAVLAQKDAAQAYADIVALVQPRLSPGKIWEE